MERYIKLEDVSLKGVAVFDENLDVLVPLSEVRKALQMTPTADVGKIVRDALSDLKREIHSKAIYPDSMGALPFIHVKTFDAILQNHINKYSEGRK